MRIGQRVWRCEFRRRGRGWVRFAPGERRLKHGGHGGHGGERVVALFCAGEWGFWGGAGRKWLCFAPRMIEPRRARRARSEMQNLGSGEFWGGLGCDVRGSLRRGFVVEVGFVLRILGLHLEGVWCAPETR